MSNKKSKSNEKSKYMISKFDFMQILNQMIRKNRPILTLGLKKIEISLNSNLQ